MTQPPRTLDALCAFFASAPFMVDLGIEPVDSGDGRVVTALTLAPRHHQHTGVVQRAARVQRLECVGVVIKPGRQISAIDGDARVMVAKASATMAVVKA